MNTHNVGTSENPLYVVQDLAKDLDIGQTGHLTRLIKKGLKSKTMLNNRWYVVTDTYGAVEILAKSDKNTDTRIKLLFKIMED